MEAVHPLKVWIVENTTQAKFASEMGISEGFLSEILKWKKPPNLDLASRMSRASGVPMASFVQREAAAG